jgi:hypothetical protein
VVVSEKTDGALVFRTRGSDGEHPERKTLEGLGKRQKGVCSRFRRAKMEIPV